MKCVNGYLYSKRRSSSSSPSSTRSVLRFGFILSLTAGNYFRRKSRLYSTKWKNRVNLKTRNGRLDRHWLVGLLNPYVASSHYSVEWEERMRWWNYTRKGLSESNEIYSSDDFYPPLVAWPTLWLAAKGWSVGRPVAFVFSPAPPIGQISELILPPAAIVVGF